MESFDYAIVGAGPTGSYLAGQLAIKGFKVGLFDKKKAVGKPVHCTGLLTSEITKYADVNDGFVDNVTERINLISKNEKLSIKSKEYVVNRYKFDNYFLKRSKDAGAKVFLGEEFINCKADKLFFSNKTVTSRVVIGCDGPSSKVNKAFGIIKNMKYLLGKQFVIKNKCDANSYDVFFDEKLKDFFAWMVPASPNLVRVGVASEDNSSVNEKLAYFLESRKIKGEIVETNAGLIPIFNPFHSNYFKSDEITAYLFGDAAGFVKASTGGGIIPSFKAIDESIKSVVSEKKPMLTNSKKELMIHLWAHNLMKKFVDKDYDSILRQLSDKKILNIIENINRDNFSLMAAKILLNKPGLLGSVVKFR